MVAMMNRAVFSVIPSLFPDRLGVARRIFGQLSPLGIVGCRKGPGEPTFVPRRCQPGPVQWAAAK